MLRAPGDRVVGLAPGFGGLAVLALADALGRLSGRTDEAAVAEAVDRVLASADYAIDGVRRPSIVRAARAVLKDGRRPRSR